MKRLLFFLTVMLAGLFFLTGCVKDNWGWPREVVFEKEGGKRPLGQPMKENMLFLCLFQTIQKSKQCIWTSFPLIMGKKLRSNTNG